MQSRKLLKEQLIYTRDKRNGGEKQMKIILLFLAALASFTVQAQPSSQTVEQTVRQIYQNYKSDASTPYFGETGERAITSARIQQALT